MRTAASPLFRPIGKRSSRVAAVLAIGTLACVGIGASEAVALTSYKTTVTAHATGGRTLVVGKVSSRRAVCRARRKVRVIEIGSTVSSTGRTGSSGGFSVVYGMGPYNQYYVSAPAKRVKVNGRTILCRAGRSPLFRTQ